MRRAADSSRGSPRSPGGGCLFKTLRGLHRGLGFGGLGFRVLALWVGLGLICLCGFRGFYGLGV